MYVSSTVYHLSPIVYYLLSYYLHSYISLTYLCLLPTIYLIIHVSTHYQSIIYLCLLPVYISAIYLSFIYYLLPISYPIIYLCICIWIYQSFVPYMLWIGARVWRMHLTSHKGVSFL